MGGAVKSVGKAVGKVTGAVGGAAGQAVGGVVGGAAGAAPQAKPIEIKDKSRFDLDKFGAAGFQTRAFEEERQADIRGAEARAKRNQLISSLQAQAGQKPSGSLAEAQLKAAQDRSLAQQLAAARSARGGNQAALQRALVQQQGAAAADIAQQASQARLQEEQQNRQLQLQTQQLLGQQIGQEQALADQLTSDYLSKGFTMAQARQQAQADLEKTQAGLASQVQLANLQSQSNLAGGLLGALGSAGGAIAASDKNVKKNVKSGDSDVKKFLDAISAKSYDYKEPKKHGKGKQTSVMAQDLEKTDIGKSFVEALSDGTKMVNYGKGFGAILAAQAHLNKRLEEIEKKKSKKS